MKTATIHYWRPVAEAGRDHCFPEDATKSVCGRKVPEQLRLPIALPVGVKCGTCVQMLEPKQPKAE